MTTEELREYGLVEMDEEEIRNFLTNRGFGVLGLPTEGAPYLLPMSFGFDGESRLYFSYFLGEGSRKVALSDAAETASFLVHDADSVFLWESVLLTGTLSELSPDDAPGDALENAWYMDLFERADTAGRLALYEFRIEERTGFKCVGLPPGLERDRSDRE
jgi:uncharacterized protein